MLSELSVEIIRHRKKRVHCNKLLHLPNLPRCSMTVLHNKALRELQQISFVMISISFTTLMILVQNKHSNLCSSQQCYFSLCDL